MSDSREIVELSALNPLVIAKGESDLALLPQMANRHGLVAGATGTGKTITIHAMAERFSEIGVPVFLADIKGDLAGLSQAGGNNPKVSLRVEQLGLSGFTPTGFPVTFWDVYGQQGHPVRATVSEMGPVLLSRLLNLNEAQSGVLQIAFKYADDQGLLLLDLKDLRSLLQYVGDNRQTMTTAYGNVSAASVGAIQRGLLTLEQAGGNYLFGEPALILSDFIRIDKSGRGVINILTADRLMQSPVVYATFLLWLLSALYESLPEVGDLDKPKLVFFFDEAHLLFNDAPGALHDKIEQVVRLIRSKGIGIYFVSQNPLDIPDVVLGQLGNRIQHALRAFTPRDQRAVKSAAETFRANPNLDVASAITELGVGEALVSFLDGNGTPGIVERALILPPCSQVGPITAVQRLSIINWSPIQGKYDDAVDRESAYEMLKAKAERAAQAEAAAKAVDLEAKEAARLAKQTAAKQPPRKASATKANAPQPVPPVAQAKPAPGGASTVAPQTQRRGFVRGILGALVGKGNDQ
jgi:DNA helicase HerA-like ATPase